MNFLTKLFNKTKNKMENKLKMLLALHAFFSYKETEQEKEKKRIERQAKIASGINKLTDDFLKELGFDEAETKEKEIHAQTNKKPESDVKTKVEHKKPEEKVVEKPAEEVKDPIEDALEDVIPFYPCQVQAQHAKFPTKVHGKVETTFKAFKTADLAKQFNNTYPTVAELEDAFSKTWDKICLGASNKEALDYLRKLIGKYYPKLKNDSDWYGAIINPMSSYILFIKSAFGYKKDRGKILVTLPNEPDLILKYESDFINTEEDDDDGKEAPAKEEKKPEEKKELKTVQSAGNTSAKVKEKDKRVDEEVQETAPVEESAETNENDPPDVDVTMDDESSADERNTEEPPAVNAFDDFNNFEKLILNKMVFHAKKMKNAKSDDEKKQLGNEAREEIRTLIAANFEDEPWTKSLVEGKWNPKLVLYHNNIAAEVKANQAKWPK